MALIKCPECGNSVSEYARVCPQCGFNIADAMRKYVCPDCGTVITGRIAPCPNCDCPPEFFVEEGKAKANEEVHYPSQENVSHETDIYTPTYTVQPNTVQHSNSSNDKSAKISFFIANNEGKLPDDKMRLVQERMAMLSDTQIALLLNTSLMSPVLVWVVSFFFGYLGIDRFLIGSIGAGVVKFLTFGGFGLWWFIDLFIIVGKTKERNYNKIAAFIL